MEPLAGGRRGGRRGGTSTATAAPEPVRPEPLPLWLWPLLLALVLAPFQAARLEQAPVSAVNALIAAALVLRGFLRPPAIPTGSASFGPPVVEPITRCLGLFLALNLLSLATSIYVHGTLTALLDLAALFGAYLLIAHGNGGRRVIRWILGALLIAGLLAAVQALKEYSLEAWVRTPLAPNGNPGWRAFGPFFNPNLLAATAILLAPVALGVMLRLERTAEVVGAGAGVLLLVAALLVSGSRGGALGLMAGMATFAVAAAIRRPTLDHRRLRALLGLALALLPLLWLLRVPMLGRLAHVHGTPAIAPGSPASNASERSNTFRKLTWRATVQIIQDHPVLGTGAGTFRFALPRYSEAGYTGMAHESYLQIAAEAGIPALLVWIAALELGLGRLLFRRGPRDWLFPGLAGGVAAAMTHNLVDYSWSVMGTALPFWALLGSTVALIPTRARHQHEDTEEENSRQTPGPRRTGPRQPKGAITQRPLSPLRRHPDAQRLFLGAAGVLLLAANGIWLAAAEHQDRAQAAISERAPRAANEEYQAAAELGSLDAELQLHWAGLKEGLGDLPGAAQSLRRAAELAPTWSRPHYRLGQLSEQAGRLQDAAAEFERAAQRDPRSTQPLVELARVREAQGDHATALAVYRRTIAMESTLGGIEGMTDPNPAIAHEALGREAEAHGDRATAVREYRAGAERLQQYRREAAYRQEIQRARGDIPAADRETELQQLEVRLWQRLAALYVRARKIPEAAEARREAAAAAASQAKPS